jgi:hypothetical protein
MGCWWGGQCPIADSHRWSRPANRDVGTGTVEKKERRDPRSEAPCSLDITGSSAAEVSDFDIGFIIFGLLPVSVSSGESISGKSNRWGTGRWSHAATNGGRALWRKSAKEIKGCPNCGKPMPSINRKT